MDLAMVRRIREFELDLASEILAKCVSPGASILEIGAGSGWQAAKLSRLGYVVTAIDIADSNYADERIWPVIEYDGRSIPFRDSCFDAVFSSNVLEHIEDYAAVDAEIIRVLKSDGIALHVVPSAAWRAWTTISHYPTLVKLAIQQARRAMNQKLGAHVPGEGPEPIGALASGTWADKVRAALIPGRHGASGTATSELWKYTSRQWRAVFAVSDWRVRHATTNGLFYSGRMLFGGKVSVESRQLLSRALGSSCHIFLLSRDSA